MIILLWISTLLIVPVLTYVALGFYVKVRLKSGVGFSLWAGMLELRPMTDEEVEAQEDVQS